MGQPAGGAFGLGTVIDSSSLIRIERASRRGAINLDQLAVDDGYVAAIALSELWAGFYLAETDLQRESARTFVESVANRYHVLPFDAEAARIRAQLFVELRRSGVTIGERDLQIAATALAAGHSVLTGNVTEFSRIPGLRVIPWPTV